jgi:hypothetical protein
MGGFRAADEQVAEHQLLAPDRRVEAPGGVVGAGELADGAQGDAGEGLGPADGASPALFQRGDAVFLRQRPRGVKTYGADGDDPASAQPGRHDGEHPQRSAARVKHDRRRPDR